jgi:ribosome-binding protein aMBF1 (putative translation factor)
MKKSLLEQYMGLIKFRDKMKKLGENMRSKRNQKNLKLSYVAYKLKRTPTLLGQIEDGIVFPDEEIVKFYDSL